MTEPASSRRFWIVLLAGLLGGAVLGSCATNPVSGRKDFVLMSETQELEAGKKYSAQIDKQYPRYDDAALQAYVQRIGAELARHSHRKKLDYRFTVVDSPEVNAFALPGGYIYITRGIMAYLNSEAELAGVLGHEIGHVTARHSVRQMSAAQAGNIVATILAGDSQAGQFAAQVLGGALLSGYGRDMELEADQLGAQYLARSGYDPEAMLEVLGVLKNQEQAEKARAKAEGREARSYHGVFASHPRADQRLREVVGEARKLKVSATPRVARAEYLKAIDKMVFGDSVREGVRRGSAFYHRDLDFAVNFPDGWRLQNTPNAVIAESGDKSAVMQLTMAEISPGTSAQEHLRARLKNTRLRDESALANSALPGYTGIAELAGPFGRQDTRVTVVILGKRAYTFFGAGKNAAALKQTDTAFLATARSLRALTARDKPLAAGMRLRTVNAKAGDNFAALAKRSPLGSHAEMTLRLINDKFPKGELTPGEVIKIVE